MVLYTQGTITLGNKYPKLQLSSRSVTAFELWKQTRMTHWTMLLWIHPCDECCIYVNLQIHSCLNYSRLHNHSGSLLMRMLLFYLVDSEELHKPFETCSGTIFKYAVIWKRRWCCTFAEILLKLGTMFSWSSPASLPPPAIRTITREQCEILICGLQTKIVLMWMN